MEPSQQRVFGNRRLKNFPLASRPVKHCTSSMRATN
jgi:hypothetical protein